jgi:hypothetical protein
VSHFRKGNDGECEQLAAVLEKYHPQLHDADLIVDVLVAFATKNEHGEPRGPALSHGGYPAIATVKINPLKQRVLGQGDALITLDGDRWGDFSAEEQRAILDHELTHLNLVVSEDGGGVEGDDIGRPKLRVVKHDHQFGWFDAVVRRHGKNSVEWGQFAAFQEKAFKQTWLPGFEASPTVAADEGETEDGGDSAAEGTTVSFRMPDGEFTKPMSLDEFKKLPEKIKAARTSERGGHGVVRRKKGRPAAAAR